MVLEELKKCPRCNERFHTEEIKRELIGSDDNPSPNTTSAFSGFIFPEDKQYAHIHTYKVTYRCKNCGHEWDDLAQKRG